MLCGLLLAVASLVEGRGLQAHGLQELQCEGSVVAARELSSCGAWASLLRGLWAPGEATRVPAHAGGF